MTALIKLSLPGVPLNLLIATAVSQTHAALSAGKHEITAIFEYQGVTFHVKPDSDPNFLINAFNRFSSSNDKTIIGPYSCNDVANEL